MNGKLRNEPWKKQYLERAEKKQKRFTSTVRSVGPDPCDCCESSWVHYQERMTSKRLSGPRRFNRKICRQCYETAHRAEAGSVRALPGGCQVCDGQAAVWFDQNRRLRSMRDVTGGNQVRRGKNSARCCE